MTTRARPHIVMLVRNRYTHDSRVEKEARALTDDGYMVTIVADDGPGLPDRERRTEAAVVRVGRWGRRLPGLRFAVHQLRLARVLRRLRPDVLHAHDTNALIPVALAARSLGVPYVYDAHELWLGRERRERSRLYFVLNQAFYGLVERLLVPRAAATITVSPPIARHLERRYGLPGVTLVPNYPESPGTSVETRDLRSLTGGERLPAGVPIVLYLGGLMAGRGLEQLVAGVGPVGSAHLVLLGEGVLAGSLRRLAARVGAADRLHLVSPVPPQDVIAVAASADVGVSSTVPSCLNNRYSLPNKLFQYMAAGIPVVASDFPQIREVVEGAGCGLVVDTTRPSEIAAAVSRLLGDPPEARDMGRRGLDAVRERYNWSTSADALLAVYARVIERPTRPGR